MINSESDIVAARQKGRALAEEAGFKHSSDLAAIATAISELTRNIVEYAALPGEIDLRQAQWLGKTGIEIIARDTGPGIPDIGQAMTDGYSTGGGLGLGLPGVTRLMDDFEIKSRVGKGTTVMARKWVP